MKRFIVTLGLFGLAWPQFSAAVCPETNPAPVVSLVEGLPVRSPFGDALATLDYLEVVAAQEFRSSRVRPTEGAALPDIAVTTKDGVTGFVTADKVVTFRTESCTADRLLMRDIPPDSSFAENTLQAKALIGVTESVAAPVESAEAVTQVQLRAGPSQEARVITSLPLYTVVYVHAEARDVVSTASGGTDEHIWYYVGSEEVITFAPDRDDPSIWRPFYSRPMLGWIDARYLIFWPQRQAVFPKGPQATGWIFDDPDLTQPKGRLEYVDEAGADRAYALLKMPLLKANDGREIYEIGFPSLGRGGEAARRTPAAPGAPDPSVVPAAELADDVRVQLARLADSSEKIDVLFVLDNTESMVKYRDAVIRGIEEANNGIEDLQAMRVAVAMFGDAYDTIEQLEAWAGSQGRQGLDPLWSDKMPARLPFQFWLSDFAYEQRFPSLEQLTETFGGAYDDPRDDLPEMGLYALKTAAEVATWQRDSVRLIFYVGDDSSRLAPGLSLDEAARAVAEELKNLGVVLIPINVAGKVVDGENNAWIEQADLVSEKMSAIAGVGGGLASRRAYGGAERSDVAQAQEEIRAVIATLFAVRGAIGKGGIDLEKLERRASLYRVPANQLLDEFLVLLAGTDRDGLVELNRRSDTLVTGYYPQADAEIFVALSLQERAALAAAFDAACLAMASTADTRRQIEQMAEAMTQSFIGEGRRELQLENRGQESVADFFARLVNLPAEYFSIFGRMSLDQFVDFVEAEKGEDNYQNIQKELCFSAELLKKAGDNVYIERADYLEPVYNESYRVFDFDLEKKPKKFEWRWGVGQGMSVYFIPQNFFPRHIRN